MNPDQTTPIGSRLIWVHVVCNIGCLRTLADNKIVTGRKRDKAGVFKSTCSYVNYTVKQWGKAKSKKCLVSGYISNILGSAGRQTYFYKKHFVWKKG